jgi:hypothetical protein
MTGTDHGKQLKLVYSLTTTNSIGEQRKVSEYTRTVAYEPYTQKELEPLSVTLPNEEGLAQLNLQLLDAKGNVLHRNFMHFEMTSGDKLPKIEVVSVKPASLSDSKWSTKQWTVLDGLKVCGAGTGYFEYAIPISSSINVNNVKESYFLIEVSAKELFVKDRDQKEKTDVDFMLGGKASPSGNPNSYPMTDETLFPSKIVVSINGEQALKTTLVDDPADHRGVLSWHHQLKDRKLREAGSYGYLIKVPVTKGQLKSAIEKGQLLVRLQTDGNGGMAVYGKSFGRYPVDPSLVLKMK